MWPWRDSPIVATSDPDLETIDPRLLSILATDDGDDEESPNPAPATATALPDYEEDEKDEESRAWYATHLMGNDLTFDLLSSCTGPSDQAESSSFYLPLLEDDDQSSSSSSPENYSSPSSSSSSSDEEQIRGIREGWVQVRQVDWEFDWDAALAQPVTTEAVPLKKPGPIRFAGGVTARRQAYLDRMRQKKQQQQRRRPVGVPSFSPSSPRRRARERGPPTLGESFALAAAESAAEEASEREQAAVAQRQDVEMKDVAAARKRKTVSFAPSAVTYSGTRFGRRESTLSRVFSGSIFGTRPVAAAEAPSAERAPPGKGILRKMAIAK